jgi:tetratricopeptide (TPR) repeat protein
MNPSKTRWLLVGVVALALLPLVAGNQASSEQQRIESYSGILNQCPDTEALTSAQAEAQRLLDSATEALKRGHEADAEGLFLAALEHVQGYDCTDAQQAQALDALGDLYRSQGKLAVAVSAYKRALIHQENYIEGIVYVSHPEVLQEHLAGLLDKLAAVYRDQSMYGWAETAFERALGIRRAALGSDFPLVATTLTNLAEVYILQRKYAEAVPVLKRALAIWEKLQESESCNEDFCYVGTPGIRLFFPRPHREIANCLELLEEVYQAVGRHGDAEPVDQRSSASAEKAVGPQYPYVADPPENPACRRPPSSACERYGRYHEIFLSRVTQFEIVEEEEREDGPRLYRGIKKALVTMEILESFKGSNEGNLVTLTTGGLCAFHFEKGKDYLVYALRRGGGSISAYSLPEIGNELRVDYRQEGKEAALDLAILRDLREAAPGGRLYGRLESRTGESSVPVAGIKLRLEGDQASLETETDGEGIFAFRGVPAGRHKVVPALGGAEPGGRENNDRTKGWVSHASTRGIRGGHMQKLGHIDPLKEVTVDITNRSCEAVTLYAVHAINVEVVWPDGQPVPNATVRLRSQSLDSDLLGGEGTTNKDGHTVVYWLQGFGYRLHADKAIRQEGSFQTRYWESCAREGRANGVSSVVRVVLDINNDERPFVSHDPDPCRAESAQP